MKAIYLPPIVTQVSVFETYPVCLSSMTGTSTSEKYQEEFDEFEW